MLADTLQQLFSSMQPRIAGLIDTLLSAALANALVATTLALFVLLLSRFVHRPAFLHALWLLVLLKLITPPLYSLNLRWQTAPPPPAPASIPALAVADMLPEALQTPLPLESAPIEAGFVAVDPAPSLSAEPAPLNPDPPLSWPAIRLAAFALWLGGSILCASIILLRLFRFRQLLDFARRAPRQVQDEVDELAWRIGLRQPPQTLLLPGPVCPLIWTGLAGPRLLLPSALWNRLDPAQRRSLLLHELAHLRRGDHFVRILELLVTILFWWNPITWLARRELRDVEEQCCDAWVVALLPSSARDYSTALLEAVDFVSSARPLVPALASGMGEFHSLKRRLTMIKRGIAPHRMNALSIAALCALGAIALPLTPSFAEEPEVPPVAPVPPAAITPVPPPAITPVPPAPSEDAFPGLSGLPHIGALFQVAPAPAKAGEDPNVDPKELEELANAEAQMQEQLAKAHRQLQEAQVQLARAQTRLSELQAQRSHLHLRNHSNFGGGGGGFGGGAGNNGFGGQGGGRAGAAAGQGGGIGFVAPRAVNPGQPQALQSVQPAQPTQLAQPAQPRVTARPNRGVAVGVAPSVTTSRREVAGADDQDKRISQLEDQLKTLIEEMRAVRQEIRGRNQNEDARPGR